MLSEEEKEEDIRLVRYELPLRKLIPKKLWEAQKDECALFSDDKLFREAIPDSIDWRLRIRYNSLLSRMMDPHMRSVQPMTAEQIFGGICSYEVWKRRISLPAKAVFITKKLGSYQEDQDAILTAFSTRLWEIASMPITRRDGSIDIEGAKMLHKTIQLLLDRKFGAAVQRQINLNGPASPLTMDPQTIEIQLKQLEAIADGQEEP